MSARSFFAVVALVLLPMVMVREAIPAGIATHGEVCQRAVWPFTSEQFPVYQQYLAQHQDALQAGTVFPDWGYQFGYNNESEAAHWEPFIRAAAAYIHSTYLKPWDEETEKSAVFLLGIMSHSTADILWHSLGVSQGFLDAMGKQDFHGNYDDAHTHGDFGGDVLCTYERDLSWMVSSWYVPVVDMARVYNNLGYDRVTPDILTKYTLLLFLAAHIERSVAAIIFPLYAALSPFLVEQYQDYFVGGLDDMAVHTCWRWHDVIEWMENGAMEGSTRVDGVPVLDPWNGAGGPFPGDSLSSIGDFPVSIQHTERGVIFKFSSLPESAPTPRQGPLNPLGEDRSISYKIATPYAYLGTSLAKGDFNHDGLDDLVMGAPGYAMPGQPQRGAVHLVYGRQAIIGHERVDLSERSADLTLVGPADYGRFGWSLAVVDLNADGFDDLAVSAPTAGSGDAPYQGKVFVYYGDSLGKGLLTDPAMVITAKEDYTNLGWSLASGDCDGDGHGDLITASPFAGAGGEQRGLVAVFVSSHDMPHEAQTSLDDAQWVAFGEHDYDWFGYHVACADMKDEGRFILVGAPSANRDTLQSTGTLYGFDISGTSLENGSALPRFSIAGISEFDKTASCFSFGDPFGTGQSVLAVSSPTQRANNNIQAGSVVLVPLDALQGEMRLDSVPRLAAFLGTEPFARLGCQTGFTDFNNDGIDDLWVTEPYRTTDAGVEAGVAYLWLGGSSFPTGSVANSAESAFWNINGLEPQTLFGSAIAFPDFNGDGSMDVAMSAPRASSAARSSGVVHLVITPAPTPVTLSPNRVTVGTHQTCSLSGERFYAEGISIRLMRGEYTLIPSAIHVVAQDTIQFDIDIPDDSAVGDFILEINTIYGRSVLDDALRITGGPSDESTGREGGGCGCAQVDSTTRQKSIQLSIPVLMYCLPLVYVLMRRRRLTQRRQL